MLAIALLGVAACHDDRAARAEARLAALQQRIDDACRDARGRAGFVLRELDPEVAIDASEEGRRVAMTQAMELGYWMEICGGRGTLDKFVEPMMRRDVAAVRRLLQPFYEELPYASDVSGRRPIATGGAR